MITVQSQEVCKSFSLFQTLSLSSLLMVPRARSVVKRRQIDIVHTEKIKEVLLAGK